MKKFLFLLWINIFAIGFAQVNLVVVDGLCHRAMLLQGEELVFRYTTYMAKPSKAWQILS